MDAEREARAVGERAEQAASWYFRLNGFLSIPGYVVHPDQLRRFPRTEADLMAVRFPYSVEKINRVPMSDDRRINRTCETFSDAFRARRGEVRPL